MFLRTNTKVSHLTEITSVQQPKISYQILQLASRKSRQGVSSSRRHRWGCCGSTEPINMEYSLNAGETTRNAVTTLINGAMKADGLFRWWNWSWWEDALRSYENKTFNNISARNFYFCNGNESEAGRWNKSYMINDGRAGAFPFAFSFSVYFYCKWREKKTPLLTEIRCSNKTINKRQLLRR